VFRLALPACVSLLAVVTAFATSSARETSQTASDATVTTQSTDCPTVQHPAMVARQAFGDQGAVAEGRAGEWWAATAGNPRGPQAQTLELYRGGCAGGFQRVATMPSNWADSSYFEPTIAIDAAGDPVVVAHEGTPTIASGRGTVRRGKDRAITIVNGQPQILGKIARGSNVELALEQDGTALVAAAAADGIRLWQRRAGSERFEPLPTLQTSIQSRPGVARRVALTSDGNGDRALAWIARDGSVLVARARPGAGFEAPTAIRGPGERKLFIDLATSAAGRVIVTWTSMRSGDLHGADRPTGGDTFTRPVTLFRAAPGWLPGVVIGRDGTAIVASITRAARLVIARWPTTGPAQQLRTPQRLTAASPPALTLDASGTARVVTANPITRTATDHGWTQTTIRGTDVSARPLFKPRARVSQVALARGSSLALWLRLPARAATSYRAHAARLR
jgi:hypothetical protein